jgi:hypothetical protein
MHTPIVIFRLAIRIIAIIVCVRKAKNLNRSQFGWAVFGFLIPIVAIIWIQFMRPILKFEEQNKTNPE